MRLVSALGGHDGYLPGNAPLDYGTSRSFGYVWATTLEQHGRYIGGSTCALLFERDERVTALAYRFAVNYLIYSMTH